MNLVAADVSPLDLTFDPGTNIIGIVQAIELQPDGKILAAGGLYIGPSPNSLQRFYRVRVD